MVADTVFTPAPVELRSPVATPAASVVDAGWVSEFPAPVAASTTVAPLMGLPRASNAVTVIVEEPLPATSEPGLAATLDCDADTAPGITVTVSVCVTAPPLAVADTTLVPAALEESEPVALPLASVGAAG